MQPTQPWRVIAVDMPRPFPTTQNKNRYQPARDHGCKTHAAIKRFYDSVEWQVTKQEKA